MVRQGMLLWGLFAITACTRTVATTSVVPASARVISTGGSIGAATSRGAIEGFMTAVKAQDLQGMSAMWGTNKGAARDLMKREEMEKRLVVMQCLLMHDKWSFAEEQARLLTGGHQQFLVQIQRKQVTAKTVFSTVPGPGGRWLVENVEVAPLKDFCS